MAHGRKIAVIGLGYVGLPVAVAFAKSGVTVVGFDINSVRIGELKSGHDRTRASRALPGTTSSGIAGSGIS
jgi:UDP-N-acetyl-D-galactosamine dehydrogenase